MKTRNGFTLIELLVVIAVMAVFIGLILSNVLGAREQALDARKKEELGQLKNALRTYYNDYQRYPAVCAGNQGIAGCGSAGTSCCPCGVYDLAVGSDDTCSTVTTTYMKKFPTDIIFGLHTAEEGDEEDTQYTHYYTDNNDKFCIVATLENASDPDLLASQTRCANSCAGTGAPIPSTSYVVCP